MCSTLWLAHAWWSVLGLCIDIAGVTFLAIDLFPEYRLNIARRAMQSAEEYLLDCSQWKSVDYAIKSEGWKAYNRPENASMLMETTPMRGSFPLLSRSVNKARKAIGAVSSLPEYEADSTDLGVLRSDFKATQDAIKNFALGIENRRRPPIRFAASCVIVGFLLQLVGAWPC